MIPQEYLDRFDALQSYLDEEGGAKIVAESISDFSAFIRTGTYRRAYLTVLDNGNLRAVWKNGDDHIGLQFLGGGLAQYVVFNGSFRTSGRIRLNDIGGLIEGFDLRSLVQVPKH